MIRELYLPGDRYFEALGALRREEDFCINGFVGRICQMKAKYNSDRGPDIYVDLDVSGVADAVAPTRDEVAAVALKGMLAHPKRYKPRPGDPANWHDAICKEAFEIADAFERARRRA